MLNEMRKYRFPCPVKDGEPITLAELKIDLSAARCDVLYSTTPRATAIAIRIMGQLSEDIRIVECLAGIEAVKRASDRVRDGMALLEGYGYILQPPAVL